MRVNLPALSVCDAARVNRHDDGLRAESPRAFGDHRRLSDRRGVDRDFVRARGQHPPHVFDGADAAADRERDEDRVGDPPRHVVDQVAAVARRRDVEEDQLVGAFAVVAAGLLDRVAGIDEVNEADAFDDPPTVYVEAWDDAFRQHGSITHEVLEAALRACFKVKRFS